VDLFVMATAENVKYFVDSPIKVTSIIALIKRLSVGPQHPGIVDQPCPPEKPSIP
jgi:hypothetical protein